MWSVEPKGVDDQVNEESGGRRWRKCKKNEVRRK